MANPFWVEEVDEREEAAGFVKKSLGVSGIGKKRGEIFWYIYI